MGRGECGQARPGPTTTGRAPPASPSASPPRGLPAGPRQVGGLPAPGGQAGGRPAAPRLWGAPPVHPAARGGCVHPEWQGREAARGEGLGGPQLTAGCPAGVSLHPSICPGGRLVLGWPSAATDAGRAPCDEPALEPIISGAGTAMPPLPDLDWQGAGSPPPPILIVASGGVAGAEEGSALAKGREDMVRAVARGCTPWPARDRRRRGGRAVDPTPGSSRPMLGRAVAQNTRNGRVPPLGLGPGLPGSVPGP